VLRFTAVADRAEIEGFLFRYFAGYRRPPARIVGLGRTRLLSRIDVEEVFTFLSERARAPSTSPQLRAYVERVWHKLVGAVGSAFRRFEPSAATRRIYRALRSSHIRSRDTVVSFNYDLVFEASLPGNFEWHYSGIEPEGEGLRVLKPHGSVNWELIDGHVQRGEMPDAPVLVAPTHLKFVQGAAQAGPGRPEGGEARVGYLDVSPEIQGVWTTMEEEMHDAKALVFIGYSFPQADLYFSSVLRSVLARRESPPSVVLVNPDAVAIASRVEARFSVARPLRFFDIEQFVDSSRARVLALLGL
jgi:hypothetical protein